jgi:hypothetical protein
MRGPSANQHGAVVEQMRCERRQFNGPQAGTLF